MAPLKTLNSFVRSPNDPPPRRLFGSDEMSFVATDPSNHKGQTDTWLTPLWIIEALGNDFDLDPCGFTGHPTAKKSYCLPEIDGLYEKWSGKVWLNPPYSDLEIWLDRLANHGRGTALVFARTDTKWLQKHLRWAESVYFMRGRVKFLTENFQTKSNAGTGCVLLSYGWTPDYKGLDGWKAK